MRDGDWKLIEWFEDGSLELFDLSDDPGERKNLAAEKQEKAQELRAKLIAWREETHALMPTPNPEYQSKPAAALGAKVHALATCGANQQCTFERMNLALPPGEEHADWRPS